MFSEILTAGNECRTRYTKLLLAASQKFSKSPTHTSIAEFGQEEDEELQDMESGHQLAVV